MSEQLDLDLDALAATEYQRATRLYSTDQPNYIGQLTLGADARDIPIDAMGIYGLTTQAVNRDPELAQKWARTFGATSVTVGVDPQDSSFAIIPADSHRRKSLAVEVGTSPTYPIEQLLVGSEVDGQVAYLLTTDGSLSSVEMALIQALHLVDAAVVTGQHKGELPLVRFISMPDLVELKAKYPALFIRTYGNVRQLHGTPRILGSVIATAELERSGVATRALSSHSDSIQCSRPERALNITTDTRSLERAAFVGITVAKEPHLGSGFLLAQAATLSRKLIVYLNGSGPRVEQAVAKLAEARNISIESAVALVSSGQISSVEVQTAYRGRSEVTAPKNVPDFVLAASNEAYAKLLRAIAPPNKLVVPIVDTELAPYISQLRARQGFLKLFGDTGMGAIEDKRGRLMLVERSGKLQAAGILAAIATTHELDVCDASPPFTEPDRRVLAENGLLLHKQPSCGVMFDFEATSGTQGSSIQLDVFIDRLERAGQEPNLLLPVLKQMLDTVLCVKSEEGGICPNFASHEAALAAFDVALSEILALPDPYAALEQPVDFRADTIRFSLRELTDSVYGGEIRRGIITVEECQQLLKIFPLLASELSPRLVAYVNSVAVADSAKKIPRPEVEPNDGKVIDFLRSANPRYMFELFAKHAINPEFANALYSTKLGRTLARMGYVPTQFPYVLQKLASLQEVYQNAAVK